MAKLVKTYENGIEKVELTFRGKTFDYSLLPTKWGREGDKPAFDSQIAKAFPDLADNDDCLDWLDQISFEDSGSDVVKMITNLSRWEGGVGSE